MEVCSDTHGQSKQGSGGAHSDQNDLNRIADDVLIHCQAAYQTMIDGGVAPEQARLVLPMALGNGMGIWTGSLYAFAAVHHCRDRLGPTCPGRNPARWRAIGIADAMSIGCSR